MLNTGTMTARRRKAKLPPLRFFMNFEASKVRDDWYVYTKHIHLFKGGTVANDIALFMIMLMGPLRSIGLGTIVLLSEPLPL